MPNFTVMSYIISFQALQIWKQEIWYSKLAHMKCSVKQVKNCWCQTLKQFNTNTRLWFGTKLFFSRDSRKAQETLKGQWVTTVISEMWRLSILRMLTIILKWEFDRFSNRKLEDLFAKQWLNVCFFCLFFAMCILFDAVTHQLCTRVLSCSLHEWIWALQ